MLLYMRSPTCHPSWKVLASQLFKTAVTKALSDLFLLVQKIDGKLDEEQRAAHGREDRLNKKISELSIQLAAAESQETDAISKIEQLTQSLVRSQKQSVSTERARKND